MIRVVLQGRTGNNLFQYAAGRALSVHHGTGLILDGAWSDSTHARQFEALLRMPIQAAYERRHSLAKRLFARTGRFGPGGFRPDSLFKETPPGPDPEFFHQQDGVVLSGYFQSPAYFRQIAGLLHTELDPGGLSLDADSALFEDHIRNNITVSLHVRRGDYVNIPSTQCVDESYHKQAVSYFRERIPGVRFCVFSDDIEWCRQRFQDDDFLFSDLTQGRRDPLHDLRLMSSCAHHIIANSSYSWWGAWLNPSASKTVIAPSMWMKGMPSASVVESTWLTI